jgi:hypothetical protein
MSSLAIAKRVFADIQKGTVDAGNAIDIVSAVAKYARGDKESAVEIVTLLAKGPDGIAGTADDIPPATLRTLRILLDQALVAQLAQALCAKTCGCF